MKAQTHNKSALRAMTLVELLLVICIVGVLAAMLLPVNPRHGRPEKMMKAKFDISDLVTAIEAYEFDYGHMPLADLTTNEDFTYGISLANITGFKKTEGTRLIATNSDLVVVLMDLDFGVNAGHKLNPKQIKYLAARVVEDTNSSGVSVVDHQYRDPWGNPYVVTMDSTHDNQCNDFLYCLQKVSQWESNSQNGLNGLFNPVDTRGNGHHFYLKGKVMVWSAGPDKKFDLQTPAHTGVNKDNVLSWQ